MILISEIYVCNINQSICLSKGLSDCIMMFTYDGKYLNVYKSEVSE